MADETFLSLKRGWDAYLDGKTIRQGPKAGPATRLWWEYGWRLASIRAQPPLVRPKPPKAGT